MNEPMTSFKMVVQAEALAKRWMPGYRQGKPGDTLRKAWEHPQDLVRLLDERPGEFSEAGQAAAKAMAWLHDLLEDGKKEDGSVVTPEDLEQYVPERIVEGVIQLTHQEGHSKLDYYKTLREIDYFPKLVKCVDRICNLREGASSFTDKRWTRYTEETRLYILPLAQDLREETAEWLTRLLNEALAVRS